MKEQLLHYIWHLTHFDAKSLSTSQYFPLSIYKLGKSNYDFGYDLFKF